MTAHFVEYSNRQLLPFVNKLSRRSWQEKRKVKQPCTPTKPEGDLRNDDSQCRKLFSPSSDKDPLLYCFILSLASTLDVAWECLILFEIQVLYVILLRTCAFQDDLIAASCADQFQMIFGTDLIEIIPRKHFPWGKLYSWLKIEPLLVYCHNLQNRCMNHWAKR